MATITHAGASIHGGRVEQRRNVALVVTGAPAGVTAVTLRNRAAGVLGAGLVGQPIVCDLSALPLGAQQITVGWAGGSDTKTTTVVPDPQPGPANTGPGVPDTELEAYTSTAVIRSSTTLEGVLRTTPLVARGAGTVLTVRRSVVRCGTVSGELVVDCRDGARVVFEDSQLDGLSTARIGLGYAGLQVRRSDVHHCNDGLRMATGSVLEDSWVHDLTRIVVAGREQHPDCVQITGGRDIAVRHNTLSCLEVGGGLGNACLQINSNDPVDGVLIEDNWLNGGNWTVNVGRVSGAVDLARNRFGPDHRYGEVARYGDPALSLAGNLAADGTLVAARRL